MSRELSASALQIQEKRQRKAEMLGLAETITYQQILKLIKDNPNITEDVTIKLVKSEGIPKKEFLNEYVCDRVDVKVETAQQYFKEQRDRLNPMFREFRKDRKPYFHLTDRILKTMVQTALKDKGAKPK